MKATIFQTSWFSGAIIKTTPQKLITLAKKLDAHYLVNNNGEDKSNFDFEFEASDGSYLTVYDWKEYRPLKLDETIQFHIGQNNNTDIEFAITELQNELKKLNT